MKKPTRLILPIVALVALTSIGVVLAATTFTLTASSNVTVNAPVVAAVFTSGSLSNEATGTSYVLPNGFQGESCTVGSSGESLSCPSFSMQSGDYVVFTAVVQNTGTTTATVDVVATPSNGAVMSITADGSNPTYVGAGDNATFIFTLRALQAGNGGFTVTLSGSADT